MPTISSPLNFMRACHEAQLSVDTIGHVDIYNFYGVCRGGECQDGYDWKISIGGRGVLDVMNTLLHMLLCGHGYRTKFLCACEPSDWCLTAAVSVGMTTLRDFSFCGSFRVPSLDI